MISAPANFTTANQALAKLPIYVLEIEDYARVFVSIPVIGGVLAQTPETSDCNWIEAIDDLSITVSDLDGGADLGTLSVTVQDHKGLITADMPTALFEGKKAAFKTGFPGMSRADFATLFTGVIDTVNSANANQSYVFNFADPSQVLSKVIFTVADNGAPTDSNNLKSVNAHPLDILIDVLENQVGLDVTQINLLKILGYRDGVYAGMQFTFSIDSPPTAKDFIEQQIMKPLGGYLWVNSRGQFDVNFFYPNSILPVFGGALIGAWVDGSGVLVANPFLIGRGGTFKAPTGATHLQLGVNDHFYTDNTGSWTVDVNGSPVTVLGTAEPYAPGVNTGFSFDNSGATSPTSVAVTAGSSYTIGVSGTVFLHNSDGPSDGTGIAGGPENMPGNYAAPQVIFNSPVAAITVDNTVKDQIPLAETADLVNVLSFRFDKNSDGKYMSESIQEYAASIARFGSVGDGQLYGQQIIQSDGARSGFQGFFLAAFVARLIFLRYGLKNLQYSDVQFLWTLCVLEPGDIVAVTHPSVPDRQNGVIGIVDRPMEVLDRNWNFKEGRVTLMLLDAGYLAQFGGSLIAPDSVNPYASASADEKAKYFFMGNTSDKYSNGDDAHVLG